MADTVLPASDSRLSNAHELLSHIQEAFGASFGFKLWDGSTIGPADVPFHMTIADPGVLGALARRPNLITVVEMWCLKRIDIEDGSIFDFFDHQPRGKFFRKIKKLKLARQLLPFLIKGDDKKWSESGLRDKKGEASGSSKEAIQHHYDVSNTFYQLFLDSRMVYSCGYFRDWENDVEQAQIDKLDMICRKLRLKPGERFLDIGSGWGALVIHAVENYGVTAHGVTLSQAQYDLARERIAAKGLSDKITIELKPFQELTGTFDKIASIGMYEHVGFAHHGEYFMALRKLLRPRGLYLHHAITRHGRKSEKQFRKRGPEYKMMVHYIFPGGELDHIGWSSKMLESHGFEVHDVEGWREHYQHTTRQWAERLAARKEEAIAEVGEARYRLWLLYLAGVSNAFLRGDLLIYQTLASRRDRGPAGLPPTREDLYKY